MKGSGLYFPIGRTLVAYNKVHALKLLNVSNTDIVMIGRDFQSFLKNDSDTLWKSIQRDIPNANRTIR